MIRMRFSSLGAAERSRLHGVAFVLTALPLACVDQASQVPTTPENYEQVWGHVRAADQPRIAPGWEKPVRLDVSGGFWGDSLWVDGAGQKIYFMVYEGDAMTDMMIRHQPTSHPEVYVSDYPFKTKRKVTEHNLSHPIYGNAGPMIDANGDFWYMSNRKYGENGKLDTDIYKNDERLPFNTDESETNPHYCVATDELWFDMDDKVIMVLEHAARDHFAGKPRKAPKPINSEKEGTQESQPWLSVDGKRMYFSSTRGHQGGPYIYTSTRNARNEWSEPVAVVSDVKNGVGEPSLPNDESKLFFEQILRNDAGGFTTEFFFIQKAGTAGSPPPAAAATAATTPAPAAADASYEALPLTDFAGLGGTKSAQVDAASSALVWDYKFKGNPFSMIADSKVAVKPAHKGVAMKLTSDKATTISLVVSEKGGIRYNYIFDLDAGQARTLRVPWAEFANQPDSPDPNHKLDLDKIDTLGMIDAKAILKGNASGDNVIRVEYAGLMK